MRCIPNMIVCSPMNEIELRNMMYTASLDEFKDLRSAISIRYPRGEGVIVDWKQPFEKMEIGKGRKIKEGKDVAILTIGHIGNYALEACEMLEKEGIYPGLYDMRFVKPLDTELLDEILERYQNVITVEDGTVVGGFGSAILEYMASKGCSVRVKILGIQDRIFEHGTQMELHKESGFDPQSIAQEVKNILLPAHAFINK
jgi:1-deoxy-D-xylulose-5-phosphate synthase